MSEPVECDDSSPLFRGDSSPSHERTRQPAKRRSRLAPALARGAHPPSRAVLRALAENRRGTRVCEVSMTGVRAPTPDARAHPATREGACAPRRFPRAVVRRRQVACAKAVTSHRTPKPRRCGRFGSVRFPSVSIGVHPWLKHLSAKKFLNAFASACSKRTNRLTGTARNRHSEARIFADDGADDQRGGDFSPRRWEKLK